MTASLFAQGVSEVPGMILGSGFENITPNMAMGDPLQVGEKYIIPVFEVNTFFIGGAGGDPMIAAGTSGSVSLIPYSVIIISGDNVEIRSLSNKEPVLKQLMEVLPQALQMIMQYFSYMLLGLQGLAVSEYFLKRARIFKFAAVRIILMGIIGIISAGIFFMFLGMMDLFINIRLVYTKSKEMKEKMKKMQNMQQQQKKEEKNKEEDEHKGDKK